MSELVLGPWAVGIDHVTTDTATDAKAVRDAVNGDFDRSGQFTLRHGYDPVLSGTGIHSLWSGPTTGITLCVHGASLCLVTPGLTLTPIYALSTLYPMSYTELNGAVLASNIVDVIKVLPNGTARALSQARPARLTLAATANGGLDAGRYGVAQTLVDQETGDESGLSEWAFVNVAQGGGIALSNLADAPGCLRYVYRTPANGDALYLAANLPTVLTNYLIGTGALGRLTDTANLSPLPAGQFIRAWRGRAVVARGNVLYFSEPLRYGLHSPRHGFVQFANTITMMECVESGIFVGTEAGIVFLQGSKPDELTVIHTGGKAPYPGSGLTFHSSNLGGDLGRSGQTVAAWLAPNGYVVGTASGQITELQSERIAIPIQVDAGQGRTFLNDRRLTTLFH